MSLIREAVKRTHKNLNFVCNGEGAFLHISTANHVSFRDIYPLHPSEIIVSSKVKLLRAFRPRRLYER